MLPGLFRLNGLPLSGPPEGGHAFACPDENSPGEPPRPVAAPRRSAALLAPEKECGALTRRPYREKVPCHLSQPAIHSPPDSQSSTHNPPAVAFALADKCASVAVHHYSAWPPDSARRALPRTPITTRPCPP